jgi:threonyl-tRNA synthetase
MTSCRKSLKAEEARVYMMLVVGQREQQANTVSVRIHGKGDQGTHPLDEVVNIILTAIKERSQELSLKK